MWKIQEEKIFKCRKRLKKGEKIKWRRFKGERELSGG